MKRVGILMICAGVLLSACAPVGKNNIVALMSRTFDRSPEYQHGYMDGCGSGRSIMGDENHMHFKDLNRYNGEYRLGWDDGLENCSQ